MSEAGQDKQGLDGRGLDGRGRDTAGGPRNGDLCIVVGGTHAGRSGEVQDRRTSKTGHVTITVREAGGSRFKTLARNVVVTGPVPPGS